jgi:hypothetical protein
LFNGSRHGSARFVTLTRADIDRWIAYHSEISYHLTMERTALESALIPVSAYIVIACVESYRRYPEMIDEITGAMAPELIGAAGHRLNQEIDPVRLWAVPNFFLIGRKILATAGLLDPVADEQRCATVFDFWERAARAYRFDDGTHQAADVPGVATPFRVHVDEIVERCEPFDEATRARATRLNAFLTSYLFLLWFDTRSGYQDTGPYRLADGSLLLLRRYVRLGVSHFPWSAEISAGMPYREVLGAFILRDVELRTTDFGTSVTKPEDYWRRVEAGGFFDVADGTLEQIRPDGRDALGAAAKVAQKQLYRSIAGMERNQKIDNGAYVYFTFLRPFAEVAGVELDWTVPRDSLDLYPFLSLIDGSLEQASAPQETPENYYAPLLPLP